MITKSPFARTAEMYRGSPWILWLTALTQTLLALDFLLLPHDAWWRWLGAMSAVVAVWCYGALFYLYKRREQLAASPIPPYRFGKLELLWTLGILLGGTAVFVILLLTVWRS